MDITARYPNALKEDLQATYLGKKLEEADTPAAIIDVAAARRNCQSMLEACDALGVRFRAHVKTHKVSETRFCGTYARHANLIDCRAHKAASRRRAKTCEPSCLDDIRARVPVAFLDRMRETRSTGQCMSNCWVCYLAYY